MSELNKSMERARKNLIRTDEEVDAWENQLDVIHKETELIDRACGEVKAALCKADPEQMKFAFMPHSIARVSPFFPMNRRDLGNRKYQELNYQSSWGTMAIKGIKLSLYDETVLLSILKLAMDQRRETVNTTRYELCKVMGIKTHGNAYKTIMESIKRLTGTVIELSVKGKMDMVNTILSGAEFEANGKNILITLNPYFMRTYAQGLVSNINLEFRNSLKGDYSKSLYRFLISHKGNKSFFSLDTIARAINIDMNIERWEIRARVKRGLAELRKKGFLERFMVKKNDTVHIWKKSNLEKH